MTRSRRQRHPKSPKSSLKELGFRCVVLGLAFLIIPLLFGPSSMLRIVAAALSFPGWLLLAVGALLLGVDFLKKHGDSNSPPAMRGGRPAKSWSLNEHELRGLTEPTFRDGPARAVNAPSTRFGREPHASPDIEFGRVTGNTTTARHQPESKQWSPAVFAAIEWRRFEAVCETLFAQAGFETRSQTHGADGGVDIWLYSRHAEGPAAIVQCKHWQGTPVGVKEVREFYGVMASHKLQRGTYATTSVYTADAQQFAKANGVNAMDGSALLRLIATRSPEQQESLLTVAFEGEYWRPTCASCGIKLVERTPTRGGAAFWGCSNYPRCKSRLPMVAALR